MSYKRDEFYVEKAYDKYIEDAFFSLKTKMNQLEIYTDKTEEQCLSFFKSDILHARKVRDMALAALKELDDA